MFRVESSEKVHGVWSDEVLLRLVDRMSARCDCECEDIT